MDPGGAGEIKAARKQDFRCMKSDLLDYFSDGGLPGSSPGGISRNFFLHFSEQK